MIITSNKFSLTVAGVYSRPEIY